MAQTRQLPENSQINKLAASDRPAHDWYRFVLSFPPHLVRQYLTQFNANKNSLIVDPFCGTGTTLVECKKLGIASVGVEPNPMAHFAARVKTDWNVDGGLLLRSAEKIVEGIQKNPHPSPLPAYRERGKEGAFGGLWQLPEEAEAILLANSISPLPLHKTLVLLDAINKNSPASIIAYHRLALARGLVTAIGNLRFGPEVGVGPPKEDAPVLEAWLQNIRDMAGDLAELKTQKEVSANVHQADSRSLEFLPANSVDAVITSPPYPNEKDYTRTTRLESVILGFLRNKADLRSLKNGLMRSNTRNVYKADDDDRWIENHGEIRRISEAIEARRIELGKTSGFERLYPRVTRLYFGGMARHLEQLKRVVKPGAKLAYVVGDQASYLRIMIRTGQLLADIASNLGYEVIGIDLFRTRLATATGEQLREEVVILRWPGPS